MVDTLRIVHHVGIGESQHPITLAAQKRVALRIGSNRHIREMGIAIDFDDEFFAWQAKSTTKRPMETCLRK